MKHLLSILIFFSFMSVAYSASYELVCPEGRWTGHGISTYKKMDEASKFDDGMHLKKQIIRFTLPAKIGDPVVLEYGEKLYTGVVTYFYDHTKNNANQSYLIVVSHPFSLEDRHVIQINSGWTHYTYTKATIGTNGEVLVTTTLTAKCDLKLESY